MAHDFIFAFDVETIPDVESVSLLCDTVNHDSNLQEKRTALNEYHLELTNGKNSFPRQLFHQIICLSCVSASVETRDGFEVYRIRNIHTNKAEGTEAEIISGLCEFLTKKKSRLVSFNGKGFDIPVIKYRALKHNIPLTWLYQSGDKWNSYNNRYSLDWHCDLLEAFSDFGTSARIKLKEVCALLRIPCKYDIDGSSVQDLYDQGQISHIRNYCEIDALTNYILYLHYALHTGRSNISSYNVSNQDLITFLSNSNPDTQAHLHEFLQLWMKLNSTNTKFISD